MPRHLAINLSLAAFAVLWIGSRADSAAESEPKVSKQVPATGPESPLDFETYRTRIEPIFLKLREGGVRCYNCHSTLVTRLRLEPLAPGSSGWTEEQSRKNFVFVQQLIAPGDPLKSRLLLHPLAPAAGGDPATPAANSGKRRATPNGNCLPSGYVVRPSPPLAQQRPAKPAAAIPRKTLSISKSSKPPSSPFS